jgi:hypothetical protein
MVLPRDQRRVQILENYCALATRDKIPVENAMQSFALILKNDQEYLPAILGMATGFMIEKNQVRTLVLLSIVCNAFSLCFISLRLISLAQS